MVPQTHAVLRNNDVMEHDSFTFAKNVSSFSEPSYFTFQLPYLTSIKTNAFRTLFMVFYYTRCNNESISVSVTASEIHSEGVTSALYPASHVDSTGPQ